jgi:hypothetical protein
VTFGCTATGIAEITTGFLSHLSVSGTNNCKRVFITNVKGTFFGMSESEEASKRR